MTLLARSTLSISLCNTAPYHIVIGSAIGRSSKSYRGHTVHKWSVIIHNHIPKYTVFSSREQKIFDQRFALLPASPCGLSPASLLRQSPLAKSFVGHSHLVRERNHQPCICAEDTAIFDDVVRG